LIFIHFANIADHNFKSVKLYNFARLVKSHNMHIHNSSVDK